MSDCVAAVTFDVFGTLLELDAPVRRLRENLAAVGVPVAEAAAGGALRTEIAYYLRHHLEGRDAPSLAALRERCATVLLDDLAARGVDVAAARPHGRDLLMRSLRFRVFPDVRPALERLAAAGLRLGVVSNWDYALEDALTDAGIAGFFPVAISSAGAGVAKPNPRLFFLAARALGVRTDELLHVGDSLEEDAEAARVAGGRGVLLQREEDAAPPPPRVPLLRTLADLSPPCRHP